MAAPLYVVEHWEIAEPDAGRRHLIARGHDVRVIEPWRGQALPDLTGDEAGVLVMGGPQHVTAIDDHPFLHDECRFIEQAMEKAVPLVGVCLGSQLIAHVLGATVANNPGDRMTMGYYDLDVTEAGRSFFPHNLKTLNGNRQSWSLPDGAVMLAHGAADLSPNQAFAYGDTTVGLQFHPEVTRTILDQWQRLFVASIGHSGAQTKAEQDAGFDRHDAALKQWYCGFLDRWFQTHRAT